MSRGVNKVILIGNLGSDPKLEYTNNGTARCAWSMAINESYKDREGNKQELTEWVHVVAWGNLAETCARFLAKGKQVYVDGKLRTRSWEDRDSGQKRYKTEVVATDVQFLGGPEA